MDNIELYILHIFMILIVIIICGIVTSQKFYKLINATEEKKYISSELPMNIHLLSFEECNKIVDAIIEEIYGNKYLLYFRLKEICIIPNMEQEIRDMTTDVLGAISEDTLNSIYHYYTKDYFIKMVTRRVQIILVDYTNKYKPNAK